MKYANQINLAIVVVAVVILAYAFSSTYMAEESTASFQASLPPASTTSAESDAPAEREPDVSSAPSGRTSVPASNRPERNRPGPATENPDVPQETGEEEMVQSPSPAAGDAGGSGLIGTTGSSASRPTGSGFTRPSARNTPNRPATTSRRPVPVQNQRGIIAGARSGQPPSEAQQPATGEPAGVQPPAERKPTPPPATPPAAGNRRQSPPPPPTRSSVPNR